MQHLDPAYAESGSEILVVQNIMESLLRADPATGLPAPAAARDFKVSPDGLKLVLRLRSDLYWSNGEKVTADDFVFSLRRLLGGERAVRLASVKGAFESREGAVIDPAAVGIRAADDATLELELKAPDPFLPHFLAHPASAPVHSKTLDRYGAAWTQAGRFVGNGPFILNREEAGVITLVKNPHHRAVKEMRLDEVRVRLFASAEAAVNAYLAGELDLMGHRDFTVPPGRLKGLIGKKDLVFQSDLRTYFLRLNTGRDPLSQRKVREALAMSLDRRLLAESLLDPGEKPAVSLVPPGIRGYEPPSGYLFSIAGARRTLGDLGYCVRGRAAAGCKQLPTIEMIHRDFARYRRIALALGEIFKRSLGSEVFRLEAVGAEDFERRIRAGEFQMALDDLSAVPEHPFVFLDAFVSGRFPASAFHRPEFDSLVEGARGAPNWEEACRFMRQAESLLLDEAPLIPIFHGTTALLMSPRLRGLRPNPFDLIPLRLVHFLR